MAVLHRPFGDRRVAWLDSWLGWAPLDFEFKLPDRVKVLYVAGNSERCKVGVSQHPLRRVKGLEKTAGWPFNVKVSLNGWYDAFAVEKLAQSLLAEHRRGGEWFACAADQAVKLLQSKIDPLAHLLDPAPDSVAFWLAKDEAAARRSRFCDDVLGISPLIEHNSGRAVPAKRPMELPAHYEEHLPALAIFSEFRKVWHGVECGGECVQLQKDVGDIDLAVALGLVKEARLLFGVQFARTLWLRLGLPSPDGEEETA